MIADIAYDYGLLLLRTRHPFNEVRVICLEKFASIFSEAEIAEAMNALSGELTATYVHHDPSASVDTRLRNPDFWWYTGPSEKSPCWNSYVDYLNRKSAANLEQVDRASTRVLSLCEAPSGDSFSSRGLVVGYVQSGKTTNFAAVMAKAADAGYNFFIVLSGVTNSLRNQTQVRLEESFKMAEPSKWFWLTSPDDDFTALANASHTLGNHGTQAIAVVKKNSGRLKRLVKWMESATPEVRSRVAMMIIDDEADQATINTAKAKKRRTAVNQQLMNLLDKRMMPKSAYIGYSATPFANLLLDPDDRLAEDPAQGPGLYPRDFIVSLDKGAGYFGPEELFGREPVDEADEVDAHGADIVREIPSTDRVDLGTAINPNAKTVPEMTLSLAQSIDWFVLATAVRRFRGQGSQFSTMLVHVSARVKSHADMASLIQAHLSRWRSAGYASRDIELEALWNGEADRAAELADEQVPPWVELREHLPSVIETLRVVTDNSQSQDRLDYSETESPDPVIVVGGNTLARGLTLEGLVSTYFMRTSSAYDSLLQMGRWFGYRRGYADLQRIWMPADLAGWFRDLALVEEEIRAWIRRYEEDEVTPLDMPVLIRTHPSMSITSAAKMKDAIVARYGFSEKRVETILFPIEDKAWLERNLAAGKRLVESLVRDGTEERSAGSGSILFENVRWSNVREFLMDYRFSERSKVVDPKLMIDYVEEVQTASDNKELEDWNVFIYGVSAARSAGTFAFDPNHVITKISRSRIKLKSAENSHANIHHLVTTSDAVIDLPARFAPEIAKLMKRGTPLSSWANLRRQAGLEQRGLIGLYVIDAKSPAGGKDRLQLGAAADVLGVGIFFPKSELNSGQGIYVSAPATRFEARTDQDRLLLEELDAQLEELVDESEIG